LNSFDESPRSRSNSEAAALKLNYESMREKQVEKDSKAMRTKQALRSIQRIDGKTTTGSSIRNRNGSFNSQGMTNTVNMNNVSHIQRKPTVINTAPSSLKEAQEEIQFDRELKERAAMKGDSQSKKRFKFQSKYLDPVQVVVILIYYVVMPFV